MKLAQSLWRECVRGAPFLVIYFGLAVLEWVVKLRLTGTRLWNGKLVENHDLLLAFQYTNNEQSRIFQWAVPEMLFQVLPVSIPEAYSLQRIGFVFAALALFHRYLRRWFSSGEAFACVLMVAAIMPLTYRRHLQESAPLLMLTFVLILWAIRERNQIGYAVAMVLGALTNETALALVAVHFFFGIEGRKFHQWFRPGLRSLALSLPAYAVAGTIRYITRDRPHLGGAYHLERNLKGISDNLADRVFNLPGHYYLHFIVVFGALWVICFLGYKAKPMFMRRSLWFVPLFIVPHFITGKINEPRQMIPLGFVLIPAAAFYLFRTRPGGSVVPEPDRAHEQSGGHQTVSPAAGSEPTSGKARAGGRRRGRKGKSKR